MSSDGAGELVDIDPTPCGGWCAEGGWCTSYHHRIICPHETEAEQWRTVVAPRSVRDASPCVAIVRSLSLSTTAAHNKGTIQAAAMRKCSITKNVPGNHTVPGKRLSTLLLVVVQTTQYTALAVMGDGRRAIFPQQSLMTFGAIFRKQAVRDGFSVAGILPTSAC